MSREEELAAKGQLLEDHRQTKERVATMRSELERQCSLLNDAKTIIRAELAPKQQSSFKERPESPWPGLLPYDTIQKRIEEYKVEKGKLDGLASQLRLMGIDNP